MSEHGSFLVERDRLVGLAYRMLGEVGRAEDVVQEAWIRWEAAVDVRNPAAWLTTVVTRLCLDELGSARARRETYVGPWLPEPFPTEELAVPGELAESLSMAFVVMLERLTPPQRAAFLLHDVFDYDFELVARVLQTSPANARKLASRARKFVAIERPRFDAPGPDVDRITASFGLACLTGDLDGLEGILSDEATLWSDGGGKVNAARRPIYGAQRIARFLVGVSQQAAATAVPKPASFNGQPAAVIEIDGQPDAVMLLDISGGRVVGVRIVRNPAKLAHLSS